MTTQRRDAQQIADWLVAQVAKLLDLDRAAVSPEAPLADYLTDSRDALSLTADLQVWLGREVSAYVMWDFPSIAAVAAHLAAQGDATPGTR